SIVTSLGNLRRRTRSRRPRIARHGDLTLLRLNNRIEGKESNHMSWFTMVNRNPGGRLLIIKTSIIYQPKRFTFCARFLYLGQQEDTLLLRGLGAWMRIQ